MLFTRGRSPQAEWLEYPVVSGKAPLFCPTIVVIVVSLVSRREFPEQQQQQVNVLRVVAVASHCVSNK
jgi:hypothetical protein